MPTLLQDLRVAIRSYRRQPLVAIIAVITLAVGVGATTTMFSVVQAILLRPLPYPHADRIVVLQSHWPKTGERSPLSAPDFHDVAEQNESFVWGKAGGASRSRTSAACGEGHRVVPVPRQDPSAADD